MQVFLERLAGAALIILTASCASTYSDFAEKARKSSSAAESADLYLKAAELAAPDSSDLAGMYLVDAGNALGKVPGKQELALQTLNRARDTFRTPTRTFWSRDVRTSWMAKASADMAGITSKFDSSRTQKHIDDVMAACQGAVAAESMCFGALFQARQAALTIPGGKAKFNVGYGELKQPIASRFLSTYDELIKEASQLGLVAEAADIAKARAAVLSVEGPSPARDFLSQDPAQLRQAIEELNRQAQRYSELGVGWLVEIRRAEAAQVSTHLSNVLGAEKLEAEQRQRRQASNEQSLKDLERLLAIRAGGGTSGRASSAGAPVGPSTTLSATQPPTYSGSVARSTSGDRRVWDSTNYSNCVQYTADLRNPGENLQWYTIKNTCTIAIKVWQDTRAPGQYGDLAELRPGTSNRNWWLLSNRTNMEYVVCRASAPSGEDMHLDKPTKGCYHYPR